MNLWQTDEALARRLHAELNAADVGGATATATPTPPEPPGVPPAERGEPFTKKDDADIGKDEDMGA